MYSNNAAAKHAQFRNQIMQRFISQSQLSEHPRCEENEKRGGKKHKQAGETKQYHRCQSGEAINYSVTIKRERVWSSQSRVHKRNTTEPGATGASSCRALMGVRSGWLSVLRLMAHSSGDGPWHQWQSTTHLFNQVYTLEGLTMEEVERQRVRENGAIDGQRSSYTWVSLSALSLCHLLPTPCLFSA